MSVWMIYGAYGYTGELVAEEALRRGHRPVLAGRSAEKVGALAQRLGLEGRVVVLGDREGLRAALADVSLVFHAAGPFVHTSDPMIRACLAAGVHYLDITGEVPVFENTFVYDKLAEARGITLMSGVGFDVIPTDCMARYVAEKLPGATDLELAVTAIGHASAGTTKTMVELLPQGGRVRRQGKLVPYPVGLGARKVRFPHREHTVVPIPWGDLATAYRSTGIPNITTYMAFPRRVVQVMPFVAPFARAFLALTPLRRLAQRSIEYTVAGPDEARRETGRSYVWARASKGEVAAQAWLETLEGYQFTAVAGVRVVERVLAGVQPGALTPAQAFGADFVMTIEGTRRYDYLPAAEGQ
jgi:short subunit dehydrogenase-like uncharacterized protein